VGKVGLGGKALESRRFVKAIRVAILVLFLALVVGSFLQVKPANFVFIENIFVFWVIALLLALIFAIIDVRHEPLLRHLRYVSLVLILVVYAVGIFTANPACVFYGNELDYSSMIATGAIVLAALSVRHSWCRYFCPRGAIHGLAARVSRRQVLKVEKCPGCGSTWSPCVIYGGGTDCKECLECGICETVCPVGAVKVGVTDQTSCIHCYRCVDSCPAGVRRIVDDEDILNLGAEDEADRKQQT